jgi:hypothetical protein
MDDNAGGIRRRSGGIVRRGELHWLLAALQFDELNFRIRAGGAL